MSEDDHIAVKIDGVLYVKLEDATKLRAELDRIARERDEARAEIKRMREALQISVDELLATIDAALAPATPPPQKGDAGRRERRGEP